MISDHSILKLGSAKGKEEKYSRANYESPVVTSRPYIVQNETPMKELTDDKAFGTQKRFFEI